MGTNKWNAKKKIIIVSCVVIYLISCTISYSMIKKDDLTIQKSYKNEKLRWELLKNVPESSIREGEGFDIEKISDNIEYTISSKKDKIVFSYNLKDYKDKYNAKIVLSNDYEIISKEYSVDMISSFEEYKKQYLFMKLIVSCLNGGIGVCLYGAFMIIVSTFSNKKI